jgi:type IV pilus assembly protein PilE
MKTHGKKRSGFTIIELMIVIGIVALLVTLAYPAYSQYVRKARRGEAQQLLLNWSINQEIWRSNNSAYADRNDLPAPAHDDYLFRFKDNVDPTATEYTLEAAASGNQTNDVARDGTSCATLTLNQSGMKTRAACWD